MDRYDGNSDCGLVTVPWREWYPDATVVVIDRPIVEVAQSLRRIHRISDVDQLIEHAGRLIEIPALRIPFHDVNSRLQEITEYCGVDFDEDIATIFTSLNVQAVL